MCDKEVQEIELTEDQIAELMEMTAEEVVENTTHEFIFDPVEIPRDVVIKLFNTPEAEEGIKVAKYFSGLYTTMINMGVEASLARTITLNQQEILASEKANAVSLEVAKVQSSNNVEL